MAEQACDTAHPRIRGNANHQVVLAAVREEEGLRIVNENMNARVVVTAGVPRIKSASEVHHFFFDFHAVKVAHQRVCQQVMCAHATAKTDHRGIVRLVLHGHRHKCGCRLREFIAFNRAFTILAHARIGLTVRLHVIMHVGFMETDCCRLAVTHHNLFVRMQILVSAEGARRNHVRIKIHEERRQNHHRSHHVKEHAIAELFAINDEQDKANHKVKHGSEHQRALELQKRQQQKPTACRTENGTHGVPTIDLANRGFALEGTRQNQRNQRERHARKEARRHHPQNRKRILENTPTNITVIRRIENLVCDIHAFPERLVKIERTKSKESHENLRQRKHNERILLQQLSAHGAANGKAKNKCRKHLVKAVARRAHQQREQTNPDDFIDKRSKSRNPSNPEPHVLRWHRKLVFRHIIFVERFLAPFFFKFFLVR